MSRTYKAEPRILLTAPSVDVGHALEALDLLPPHKVIHWSMIGEAVVLFDVDDAEKVVAWLKAHGVEPRR